MSLVSPIILLNHGLIDTIMAGQFHVHYRNTDSERCSYLFDIFLGPSYNQSPPSVKYMTVSPWVVHVVLLSDS